MEEAGMKYLVIYEEEIVVTHLPIYLIRHLVAEAGQSDIR